MKADLAAPGKKLALKGITFQCCVGVLMLTIVMFVSPKLWLSVLIGILAFLIPHSIFTYWVFRYAGATKNRIVAQSLNQGMKLKLVLTSLIFVIAIAIMNADVFLLLGAYTVTMVSQGAAMLLLIKWQSQQSTRKDF